MTRRRRKMPPYVDPEPARDAMAGFLDSPKGAARPPAAARGKKLSAIEAALAEAERRSREGDWDGATGRTFVGLYALCHRFTYGVVPTDLRGGILAAAGRAALTRLRDDFGGDPDAFVDFIKWTWDREKGREEWAKSNGKERNRLGVMFQFSPRLVVDYRVAQSRGPRVRR